MKQGLFQSYLVYGVSSRRATCPSTGANSRSGKTTGGRLAAPVGPLTSPMPYIAPFGFAGVCVFIATIFVFFIWHANRLAWASALVETEPA